MTEAATPAQFQELGLDEHLLRAVAAAGFATPTAVQLAAIPLVLAGRDIRARAQTGTGKTAAFGLPLLQRLCEEPRDRSRRGNHVGALILVPTRELAMQIGVALEGFARSLAAPLRMLAVYGGVSINPQMLAMRGGADVLIATPGRLLDLQRQNAVRLEHTHMLVLDEADRMLSLGFIDDLTDILALLPRERQTLLFSATFPANLSGIVRNALRDAVEIEAEPAAEPLIEQHVYTVDAQHKAALLIELIKQRDLQHVLVFVSMKRTGDRLNEKLEHAGVHAAVFHSDRSQGERTRCLSQFRSGSLRVLIATDLAARGIDIEDLPTVINFELPRSPNDYVHRIGRTGRAGKAGVALSLICPAEYQHFGVIEKRMQQRLPREQLPGFEVAKR